MWVYAHIAADGRWLYVGITKSLEARRRQHQAKSPWFKDVAEIKFHQFASREEAARREWELIGLHRPPHNKARHPMRRPVGVQHLNSGYENPIEEMKVGEIIRWIGETHDGALADLFRQYAERTGKRFDMRTLKGNLQRSGGLVVERIV
jgi:predicted GIY-YIG superfamily endonuclease